jgi:hypothetical protein
MSKELLSYHDEIKLLYLGKLFKGDGWKNTKEHLKACFLEAGVFVDWFDLPEPKRRRFQSAAFIHDWDKRMNNFPDDFTPEEKEKGRVQLEKINPDKKLLSATGPDFLDKVLHTEVSMDELLMFYLDDINIDGTIVSFDQRIDEVSKRKALLDMDELLTKRLGGKKKWQFERELGHEVGKIIVRRLREKGIQIESPEEIPNLIKSKIEEESNG